MRNLLIGILIPRPLRHSLRKRKVQPLQPCLERLHGVPIRRVIVDLIRNVVHSARYRARTRALAWVRMYAGMRMGWQIRYWVVLAIRLHGQGEIRVLVYDQIWEAFDVVWV
jgi:hypothetical protein